MMSKQSSEVTTKTLPGMWLSATKRKDVAAASTSNNNKLTNTISLPLDWTRLGERKRSQSDGKYDTADSFCCGRRGCRHVSLPTTAESATTPTTISTDSSGNKKLLRRRHAGQIVFFLHESDPSWFQGYFFPMATAQGGGGGKAWGLLATRRQVDDCLECAEGGYRVIDLQVTAVTSAGQEKKKYFFPNIEWLGADMMTLRSPHLSMRTERLSTGTIAANLAEKLFGGLIRQARQGQEENAQTTTLDLFPDLAVVAGTMEIGIPIQSHEKELYELMFND